MKSPLFERPAVRSLGVCLVLFMGTLLIFSRAFLGNFIDFDDPDYVTQNLHVQAGLTWPDVHWAFTTDTAGNWHPLTWLSHMLDWQLFGNNPRGPHAVNIAWHALNAVMAFLALRRLTGAFWTSAACAALFAWHPLRVESVAWVAERKDVLCGFFFWTALLCYARWKTTGRQSSPSRGTAIFYWLTFLFFACGLMSKPMLVTFPFVLLLLDFWPLQRFNRSTFWRLIGEKILFFMLSIASCVITYLVQKKGGAIVESVALSDRLSNAVVSVIAYVGKFFWPFDLAVTYSLPNHWPVSTVVIAALLVLMITLVAILQWRTRPWITVGWFLFLGMLVPVIGVVQAGHQAMADRYTYLPCLGVEIALLWTLRGFNPPVLRQILMAAVVSIVLIGCAARTWNQEAAWKNSRTLYEHALAVTKNNYLAHSNLGTTLFNEGDFAGAEQHFRKAIDINPDFATARFKLGLALEELGRPDDALGAYGDLLKIRPHDADAHYNVAVILLNRGQAVESIPHFQAAVDSRNDYTSAYAGLGVAESQVGQTQEALKNLKMALKLDPHFPGVAETIGELEVKAPSVQAPSTREYPTTNIQ